MTDSDMDKVERDKIEAELASVEEQLVSDTVGDVLTRVQGLHSMARLTEFNIAAFEDQLRVLSNEEYASSLVANPRASESTAFIDRLRHLGHNYLLSAIPFLEHAALHVKTHYAIESATTAEYQRCLAFTLDLSDSHKIVRQLRHHSAHRGLPMVTLLPMVRGELIAMPVIDRRILLADNRCQGDTRRILMALPVDPIPFDTLILNDGRMVMEFAEWFFGIQALHALDELKPIDRLERRRDALLAALASGRRTEHTAAKQREPSQNVPTLSDGAMAE